MQSVSFRIWTRIIMSISYDNIHYTMGTFFTTYQKTHTQTIWDEPKWGYEWVVLSSFLFQGPFLRGNTCFTGLSWYLGTLGATLWGKLKGPSIFLNSHACFKIYVWLPMINPCVTYWLNGGVSLIHTHSKSKRSFRDALTNGKLALICVLNATGTILMKINVSSIVHFCLGKYRLSQILFEHTLY